MAAPNKKRAVEEEMNAANDDVNSSDNESLEDNSDQQMDTQQKVQIDFEARNPEDCDFHSIKKLLQQLFLKANVNLSELTETVISQNYIGSVIHQAEVLQEEIEDDDDVDMDIFGITTVVNITERSNLDCVKQLKNLLLNKFEENNAGGRQALSDVLNGADNQVGLFLNERFINIPAQIALPSFESLWKEVERAIKRKMKYDFNKYVMVCKTYKLPQQLQSKKKNGKTPVDSLIFVNQEEEYFYKEAELSFDYSVAGERDNGVAGNWDEEDEDLTPYRTVLVIPAAKMETIMAHLRQDLAVEAT